MLLSYIQIQQVNSSHWPLPVWNHHVCVKIPRSNCCWFIMAGLDLEVILSHIHFSFLCCLKYKLLVVMAVVSRDNNLCVCVGGGGLSEICYRNEMKSYKIMKFMMKLHETKFQKSSTNVFITEKRNFSYINPFVLSNL